MFKNLIDNNPPDIINIQPEIPDYQGYIDTDRIYFYDKLKPLPSTSNIPIIYAIAFFHASIIYGYSSQEVIWSLVPGAGDKDNTKFAFSTEGGVLFALQGFDWAKLNTTSTEYIYSIRIRATLPNSKFFEKIFTFSIIPNKIKPILLSPILFLNDNNDNLILIDISYIEPDAVTYSINKYDTHPITVYDTAVFVGGSGSKDNNRFSINTGAFHQLVCNDFSGLTKGSILSVRIKFSVGNPDFYQYRDLPTIEKIFNITVLDTIADRNKLETNNIIPYITYYPPTKQLSAGFNIIDSMYADNILHEYEYQINNGIWKKFSSSPELASAKNNSSSSLGLQFSINYKYPDDTTPSLFGCDIFKTRIRLIDSITKTSSNWKYSAPYKIPKKYNLSCDQIEPVTNTLYVSFDP